MLQQQTVTLDPSKEAKVQELLTDLRRCVDYRRVLVKPLFSDYGGWSNAAKVIDHITRQQAVQSLSRFGIELTLEEQSLLFERCAPPPHRARVPPPEEDCPILQSSPSS